MVTSRIVLLLIAAISVSPGCSSDDRPAGGTEGGHCYPNGTCNAGLSCLSDLCVDPTTGPDAKGPGPLADAALSPDTALVAEASFDATAIDAPPYSDIADVTGEFLWAIAPNFAPTAVIRFIATQILVDNGNGSAKEGFVQTWIGLTVAQVLTLCGTPYSDVTMVDEPPGKLRGVAFDCHQDSRPVRVVLELEYRPALFSADRDWSEHLIGQQKVVGVRKSAGEGY